MGRLEVTRANPPAYLLDTHVWLWHALGSERLPSSLRTILDEELDLWLSPVSVWELSVLWERGRFTAEGTIAAWVKEAVARRPVKDATLTREVALASHGLDLPDRDPADRLLAATALVYGLTLMTVDRRLTRARWLPTRSR
jgi:PIN domain nuclease of toxin-antitoxin system